MQLSRSARCQFTGWLLEKLELAVILLGCCCRTFGMRAYGTLIVTIRRTGELMHQVVSSLGWYLWAVVPRRLT